MSQKYFLFFFCMQRISSLFPLHLETASGLLKWPPVKSLCYVSAVNKTPLRSWWQVSLVDLWPHMRSGDQGTAQECSLLTHFHFLISNLSTVWIPVIFTSPSQSLQELLAYQLCVWVVGVGGGLGGGWDACTPVNNRKHRGQQRDVYASLHSAHQNIKNMSKVAVWEVIWSWQKTLITKTLHQVKSTIFYTIS